MGRRLSADENPMIDNLVSGILSEPEPKPTQPDAPPASKDDELLHTSIYITRRHRKQIKMRLALTDDPEEKNFSAVVRIALDLLFSQDDQYNI